MRLVIILIRLQLLIFLDHTLSTSVPCLRTEFSFFLFFSSLFYSTLLCFFVSNFAILSFFFSYAVVTCLPSHLAKLIAILRIAGPYSLIFNFIRCARKEKCTEEIYIVKLAKHPRNP